MTRGARISRRTFLRRTLAGAALVGIGGTVLRHLTGYSLDEATARRLRVLSRKEYLVLAAICRRMLAPDEKGSIDPDTVGVALVIDEQLTLLPEATVADVRALLQLVEHSPFLFSLRPSRFSRLDAAGQEAVLAGWESSALDFRRQCFAALKGLAALGYYGDPRAYAVLGFTGPMLPNGGT